MTNYQEGSKKVEGLFQPLHTAVVTGVVIKRTPKTLFVDSSSNDEHNNFIGIRLAYGLKEDIVGCRIYAKVRIYRNQLIMCEFKAFAPQGGEIRELGDDEMKELEGDDGEEIDGA